MKSTSCLIIAIIALIGSIEGFTFPVERGEQIRRSRSNTESIAEHIPAWIGTINIGTNGQTFRVILDTGSGTLAVKGSSCSSCVQQGGAIYNPSQSSPSFFPCTTTQCTQYSNAKCQNNQCIITESYLDGSNWYGPALSDVMNMAGDSATSSFVYWNNASQSFLNTYSDGIIGLGYPPLGYPASPIKDILTKNNLPDIFWLGFNVQGSGVMTLGNADSAYYTGTLQSIAVVPYTGSSTYVYYQVQPQGMTIGSTSVAAASDFSSQLVIVDSGTTQFALSTNVYNNVMNYLQSSYSNAPCYSNFMRGYTCQMTSSQFSSWPTITVAFANNVNVQVTPQDYIQPVPSSSNYYQFGIGNLGTNTQTLFGDPFITGKYMGFDRVNNRIQFAYNSGAATAPTSSSTSAATSAATSSTRTSTSTTSTTSSKTTSTTSTTSSKTTSTSSTTTHCSGLLCLRGEPAATGPAKRNARVF